MRRMYTTQGIQKLIDDSIDDAFENIEDQNLGNGLFEMIKDKDGHLRFIEGNLTVSSALEGVYSYAKWSLSGTHLMIALQLRTVADGLSVTSGDILATLPNIPNWISSKIYNLTYETDTVIIKNFDVTNYQGTLENDSFLASFDKTSTGLKIVAKETKSFAGWRTCRVQFDLIIDNA